MAKIYFFMAFISGFIAFLSTYKGQTVFERDGTIRKNRKQMFFFLILMIAIVAFSGFRMISADGMDEYAYRMRFDSFSEMTLLEVMKYNPAEPLISLVCYISTRLFSNNQGFILLTSILVLVPIMVSFSKYSIDLVYAVILLFVTGQLYNSFNGIAQYLAAAIYLYSIPCIYKRQFGRYCLIVLICSLIHTSAIVLLPIYFIALNKTDSVKSIILSVGVFIVIVIGYNSLEKIINATGLLDNYMNIALEGHHGVSIITICINCVPAVLAFITCKFTKKDRITTVFGNMCVLHAIIYIASIMDVYIARFAIFTCTFVILYLSRFILIFTKESRIFFKVISLGLYSVVCYLTINQSIYFFNFNL